MRTGLPVAGAIPMGSVAMPAGVPVTEGSPQPPNVAMKVCASIDIPVADADGDRDGLADAGEDYLAKHFAPELLAHFRNCGWSGLQRRLRLGDRNAHCGNSEVIAVGIAMDTSGRHVVRAVFLSARCGGNSDGLRVGLADTPAAP